MGGGGGGGAGGASIRELSPNCFLKLFCFKGLTRYLLSYRQHCEYSQAPFYQSLGL